MSGPAAHPASRDEDRVRLIQRALAAAELDVLVCALPSNVLLLAGYWPVVGTSVAVATRDGAVGLAVPEDERELAAAGWADPLETFAPSSLAELPPLARSLQPALGRVLGQLGLGRGRIGYEHGPCLEPSSYAGTNRFIVTLPDLLAEACPQAAPTPADDVLLDLRAVLTPRELAGVRAACRVAEDAFRAGARSIVPGASEREVAATFRAALADRAYARSRGRRIEPGDAVLVHCNSYVDGLWTDITRTYHPGEADDRARDRFEAVLEARRAGLAAVAPGVPAREVDRAARDVLVRRGFGAAFRHGLGHGVGFAAIDHNARPRLHPASDDILAPGMVFNLEPAVYLEGVAGIRHCDVVALHAEGPELLTPFQAGLGDLAPWLGVAR